MANIHSGEINEKSSELTNIWNQHFTFKFQLWSDESHLETKMKQISIQISKLRVPNDQIFEILKLSDVLVNDALNWKRIPP